MRKIINKELKNAVKGGGREQEGAEKGGLGHGGFIRIRMMKN